MRPLIDDLQKLESDEGVPLKLEDGRCIVLRAVLCHVLGDTLAMHDMFELMSPAAKLFCRACYANRDELRAGTLGDRFPHRDRNSIQQDLDAVKQGTKLPKDCGIKKESALAALKYFHITDNNTFDAMHDLLEGVVKMIIKAILNELVNERKSLTDDELNEIITEFEYGIAESRDKPSANFNAKILRSRGNSINQSAAQTWLLLRAFPFMFNQYLTYNTNFSALISCLLKVTYYALSTKLDYGQIADLDAQIGRFYDLYLTCFPNNSRMNKLHHLSHYAESIRKNGPIVLHSCMLFENKFRESKALTKTCGNFNNLSYSMTKRLNLRQVRTILHHNYTIGNVSIISSKVVRKEELDFSTTLLRDFPESMNCIIHCKINNTSFRPELVCRFIVQECQMYGKIKIIVADGQDVRFVMQGIALQYSDTLNSHKVIEKGNIFLVKADQLFTKKTYSLWKQLGDPSEDSYFSLKYNDW